MSGARKPSDEVVVKRFKRRMDSDFFCLRVPAAVAAILEETWLGRGGSGMLLGGGDPYWKWLNSLPEDDPARADALMVWEIIKVFRLQQDRVLFWKMTGLKGGGPTHAETINWQARALLPLVKGCRLSIPAGAMRLIATLVSGTPPRICNRNYVKFNRKIVQWWAGLDVPPFLTVEQAQRAQAWLDNERAVSLTDNRKYAGSLGVAEMYVEGLGLT